MSIQEQRRKAFEAWCDGKGYGSFTTRELLWPCWQAALDSIEIELPPAITTLAGPVFYAIDVRATIKAAGLKVKP